jgi:hypothetical protein
MQQTRGAIQRISQGLVILLSFIYYEPLALTVLGTSAYFGGARRQSLEGADD